MRPNGNRQSPEIEEKFVKDKERDGMRMAHSALLFLSSRRGLIKGVPREKRADLFDTFMDATGCSIHERGGRMRIVDGDDIVDPEDKATQARIAERMIAWLIAPGPTRLDMESSMPAGADMIAKAMGLNLERSVVLLEGIYTIRHHQGNQELTINKYNGLVSVSYLDRPSLRWKDGLITIKARGYPDIVSRSLAGRPVSMIFKHDILGDMTIRKLCAGSPLDGMLNIVTSDYRRRTVLAV